MIGRCFDRGSDACFHAGMNCFYCFLILISLPIFVPMTLLGALLEYLEKRHDTVQDLG